jgi:hypothetical protein
VKLKNHNSFHSQLVILRRISILGELKQDRWEANSNEVPLIHNKYTKCMSTSCINDWKLKLVILLFINVSKFSLSQGLLGCVLNLHHWEKIKSCNKLFIITTTTVVVIFQELASWLVLVQNLSSETYESIWTVGRTPWTGDQPNARPLPTHRTAQKNADTHPCLKWDSNPRSQCSSGQRQ